MLSMDEKAIVVRLLASGESLQAGRIVFQSIESANRPAWSASILESVARRNRLALREYLYDIEQVIDTARNSQLWPQSHVLFCRIRQHIIDLEKRDRGHCTQFIECALLLAELVAKISYNETDPVDPFDDDTGWWIVKVVHDMETLLRDKEYMDQLWKITLCESADNI